MTPAAWPGQFWSLYISPIVVTFGIIMFGFKFIQIIEVKLRIEERERERDREGSGARGESRRVVPPGGAY